MVHYAEDHTKHQLEETKHNGHLHLVAVGEGQLVFSYQPDLWRGCGKMRVKNGREGRRGLIWEGLNMGRKEAHKCIYLFDYNIVLALIKHTCILVSAVIVQEQVWSTNVGKV